MVKRPGGKATNYNPFTGSYSTSTHSQLQKAQLPEKLNCMVCNKLKNVAGFSQKQVAEARFCHSRGKPYRIKCISCSGTVKCEMKCTLCQTHKELSYFAKTHRRDPDNAICMECMDERLQFDPQKLVDGQAKYLRKLEDSDEDDSDDSDTTENGNYGASGSSRIDLDSLSLYDTTSSNSGTSSLNVSNDTSMNTYGRTSSGGVRLPSAESGVSAWQTVTSTRIRRGVVSSDGASSSSVEGMSSTTSTSTLSVPASPFNTNAYSKSKAPVSDSSNGATSGWSNTRSHSSPNTAASSGKFPRLKAYAAPDEDEEDTFTNSNDDYDTETTITFSKGWLSEEEDSDVPTDSDDDDDDDDDANEDDDDEDYDEEDED